MPISVPVAATAKPFTHAPQGTEKLGSELQTKPAWIKHFGLSGSGKLPIEQLPTKIDALRTQLLYPSLEGAILIDVTIDSFWMTLTRCPALTSEATWPRFGVERK